MAEFSKLNGYDVKDATARQQIADETQAREQAITEAQQRDQENAQAVEAEAQARAQAITEAVAAEASARDTAIAGAVAAEAQARQLAIEAEAAAREEQIANIDTSNEDQGLYIHFIENHVVKGSGGSFTNDGSGDCAFITGEGKTFIVDTFYNEGYEANAKPYLTAQGVTKIDYVFITHYHADHVGGLQSLCDDFQVGVVYLPQRPNSTLYNAYANVYDATISFLNSRGISYVIASNKQVEITNKLKVNIYNANHNIYNSLTAERPSGTTPNSSDAGIYADYNNLSVCYEFEYMGRKALFTGDINFTAMNNIYSSLTKVDVSTLPHHNHQDFVVTDFLDTIKPDVAVGMDTMNEYAQANGEDPYTTTMGAYRKPGRYLKANGTIVMSTFGDTIIVKLDHTGACIKQGYNRNFSDMVYIGNEYEQFRKITNEPVTITLNSGYSFDRYHGAKVGNMIVINAQLRFDTLAGNMTGVVVGNCSHKPKNNVQTAGVIMKNGAAAYVNITDSGNMYIYTNTAVTASSYVAFTLCWPVE